MGFYKDSEIEKLDLLWREDEEANSRQFLLIHEVEDSSLQSILLEPWVQASVQAGSSSSIAQVR